ncbi:MAG TPA: hypothetical protein VHB79_39340 [Polyangiaceae bacterium]|nr:hypothetical protein [Polyangiaceae bacterium]
MAARAPTPISSAECWPNYREFLAYSVPQDRALSPVPARRLTSRQEIELGIPLDGCEPLTGSVVSRAARAIAGDAVPLCFRVPAVGFRFEGEHLDDAPRAGEALR